MHKIDWNSPNFKSLSPEKINLLKNISEQSNKNSNNSSLAYWTTLFSQISSSNIKFTPSEEELIISEFSSTMTPKERANFNLLRNVFRK